MQRTDHGPNTQALGLNSTPTVTQGRSAHELERGRDVTRRDATHVNEPQPPAAPAWAPQDINKRWEGRLRAVFACGKQMLQQQKQKKKGLETRERTGSPAGTLRREGARGGRHRVT